MASRKQMQKLIELHDAGWRQIEVWFATDVFEVPLGDAAYLTDGKGNIVQIGADAVVRYMKPEN